MIKSKQDLYTYLNCDKIVYGGKACKIPSNKLQHRHQSLGYLFGFDIPINVFGPGLRINHWGMIVVNGNARIGAFCDIHQGVNIGNHENSDDVPEIGNNVWIGPGAKLFGKIHIADGCAIGANAVVNRSFNEPNKSVAGIPAKIVSDKGNRNIRIYTNTIN